MLNPQEEQEFNEIPHGAPIGAFGDYISVRNAKSFITNSLQKREEAHRVEIENRMEEIREWCCNRMTGDDEYENGYNQALSDILSLLSAKEK